MFNLRKGECTDCKLETLSGDEAINLEYLKFRGCSVTNVADILKNGVKRSNQDLVVDSIICKKEEFRKLKDKRYKAKFVGLMDIGNNTLVAIEFTLGNIDISFNYKHVKSESDTMYISLANVTVYPNNSNSFKVLE